MAKFFKTAFANNGQKLTIPETGSGLSYENGYTADYEGTTGAHTTINRQQLNELLYQITLNIGQQQTQAFSDWYTGETYNAKVIVRHAGFAWYSTALTTQEPSDSATQWIKINPTTVSADIGHGKDQTAPVFGQSNQNVLLTPPRAIYVKEVITNANGIARIYTNGFIENMITPRSFNDTSGNGVAVTLPTPFLTDTFYLSGGVAQSGTSTDPKSGWIQTFYLRESDILDRTRIGVKTALQYKNLTTTVKGAVTGSVYAIGY